MTVILTDRAGTNSGGEGGGGTGPQGPQGAPGAPGVDGADGRSAFDTLPGLMIPLYQYPSDVYTNANINGLLDLARRNRAVPTTAIINPANGPGTVTDGNYAVLIKRLRGAGIRVLGYVATGYLARTQAQVQADVDGWATWYPPIDGIFYDEMDNTGTTESVEYYQSITAYAHDQGYWPVVGNPGTGLPEVYFSSNSVDQFVIYESAGYPAEATLAGDYEGGYAAYDLRNRVAMVHTVGLDPAQIAMMCKHVGSIYVTDDVMANPYDALPPYMEGLYDALKVAAGLQANAAATGAGTLAPIDATYGATTTLDCDVADTFYLLMTGNTTLELTGGVNGQRIILRVTQDGTGGRTMAFGSMVSLSADLPSVTLSTEPGKIDLLGFVFHASSGKYLLTSVNRGF